MSNSPNEDVALFEHALGGSEEAFVSLYTRHRRAVYRFAWRMTGSVTAAEDITQECFLALMRGSAYDGSRAQLQTYLLGIARNLVFRRLRVTGRETEAPADVVAPLDVLGDLLSAERSALVQQAIVLLPPLQREALILFQYDELSLEAIAGITGAEVGAVKARLKRARESLRLRLAPLLAPPLAPKERTCL